MPGFRHEQVAEVVKAEVSRILIKFIEPEYGVLTVTRVELLDDYSQARVFLSFLGATEPPKKLLNRLKPHFYEIQGEVNKTLQMKRIPRLKFSIDESGEYVDKLEQVFKKIKEEDSKR